MSGIAANLADITRRVAAACHAAGRDPSAVQLVAVSKTFPADAVSAAAAAGHRHFGESRLQEAEAKIDALPGHLHWHFIGRVQRNKLRRILQRFGWIHGIDSLATAVAANETSRELGLFPKVFLQVNIGREATKGGFDPDALRAEIPRLLALDRLEIHGLMCIPPPAPDAAAARPWFAALRGLRDDLTDATGVPLPGLSMGMSGDFEVAIAEGATHVRVGSAIFGRRGYPVDDAPA